MGLTGVIRMGAAPRPTLVTSSVGTIMNSRRSTVFFNLRGACDLPGAHQPGRLQESVEHGFPGVERVHIAAEPSNVQRQGLDLKRSVEVAAKVAARKPLRHSHPSYLPYLPYLFGGLVGNCGSPHANLPARCLGVS